MAVVRVSGFVAAVAIGFAGMMNSASAAITGPYSVDANTLHLWHLNDNGLAAVDAVGTLNLQGPTANNSTTGVTGATGFLAPTFGASAFSGFGTAADFSAQATSVVGTGNPLQSPPHRPILLAAPSLESNDADTVPFTFASTPGAGGPAGAFTMEAIIKFDGSFDPASTSFRNTAANGSNAGNYFMDILMGEGDANGTRNFQWRIQQATGANPLRMEWAPLYGISGNQSLIANLPTTGPNAVNNTDWFHVAVVYNGAENTAGNVTLYWTKLDPTNTTANAIGSFQQTKDMLVANTAFSIGNEARDAGTGTGEGESFVGSIDEVRISSVARTADQFIFAVPEPSTVVLAAFGLIGLSVAIRNRKQRA
jgi:hypothetical protein